MKKSVIALLLLALLGAGVVLYQRSGGDVASLTSAAGWRTALGLDAPADDPPQDTAGKERSPRGGRGPLPVEVAEARPAQLSDDITAVGTLLAEESADIAPETSGRIAEVLVEDGQKVDADAPLFRLDAELIEAELEEGEARLKLAQSNYERNERLRKSGNVAQSTFEASATELELARTAVGLARVRLEKLTIRAPFSGTVGFRLVSVGAYVNAGTPLIHLDKTDRLKVSFSVPELEFARLAVGQEVAVVADALPGETFVATIAAIDPSVDVNGRALRVRADLDNAAGRLRPGLLVRVTVKGTPRQTVTVPEAAIVPRGNDTIVYVAEADTAKEARVKTGKRAQGEVEIVDGLSAGARVVVAGNTRLSNGAKIEIVGTQGQGEPVQ